MLNTDKKQIEAVTEAIAALYNKIDDCRNDEDGFVARCAELNTNYDNDAAMDFIMSEGSEAYELIERELIEEAVEVVRALYWAREYANSFPMKNYGKRSDGAKEYLNGLNRAIKNAPVAAETMRIKANSEHLHKIVTDFGEWVDGITANPLGVK